jgi:TolA-binding protein
VAGRRNDDVGAEAQYRVGETLALQKNYRDGMAALARVKYLYPASTIWINRSLLLMGSCYQAIGDTDRARESYQQVLAAHTAGDVSREAERRLKELR